MAQRGKGRTRSRWFRNRLRRGRYRQPVRGSVASLEQPSGTSARTRSPLLRTLLNAGLVVIGLSAVWFWIFRTSGPVIAQIETDDGGGYVVETDELPRDAVGLPSWDSVPFVSPAAEVPAEVTERVQALTEEAQRVDAGAERDSELFAFPDLPPDRGNAAE